MREGLRSGKLFLKGESGKASAKLVVSEGRRKSGDGDDCVASGSGVGKVLDLVSCAPGPERESSGLQIEKGSEGIEGGGGGDEGRSEKVGLEDDIRKRKNVDGGRGVENEDGVAKKKVKEEEPSDGKVQVFRRVLRSSTAGSGGCVKAEDQDVLGKKSGHGVGLEKTTAVESEEKCDCLVGGVRKEVKRKRGRPPLVRNAESAPKNLEVAVGRPGKVEKEEHSQMELDGGPRKKLKNKRGRPRKVPESTGVLKLKQGRPTKVPESNGVLKRTRGRPPKVKQTNAALRVKLGRRCKVEKKVHKPLVSDGRLKKKMKDRRGRPPKVKESNEVLKGDADKQGETSLEDKRGLTLHDNTKADLETMENEDSSGKTSRTTGTVSLVEKKSDIKKGAILKKGKAELGRISVVKQSVREKIIEILLSAGWTIQYRPRSGKPYLDSVYVNLNGRTHWSVTLAYNMLVKHYEKGNGDSKYYKAGFKFIPIPEDELGVLKKVMIKKREGKKKLKPGECGNSMDGVTSKKKQKKNFVGNSRKGKTKGKTSLHVQEKSASMQHKRMLVSDQDHVWKKMQNGKRRTLLVRKSMEEADSDAGGYIPYAGKRTVLGWMVDLGTVSLDAKVQYMDQKRTCVLLEGRLTRDGIHCNCCNQSFTISEFETHAGSKPTELFKNICLESGTSLLQCLLESWNKQPETERKGFHYIDVNGDDPNDDTCGICGDGGDLICCDGCPSTFHQSCLDIQKFPSGDWHCVYCSCKICGKAGRNGCQGDDNDNLATPELLLCQLCEEKYHQLCTKEKDAGHELSFCEKRCSELFEKLKKLLGVKHGLEEGFSCSLVWRSDVDSSTSACDEPQKCDVAQKIECNSKLAVALSIMDECFLPMLDHRSGINLIRNIVYNFGSNFKRLNYGGFFTAILERGDEIISAASIRIHGYQLAEMPFIGTRYMYRRQGMCRRLLSAIESVLCSLGVERLVIPAISELEETWTSVFGFRPLEVSSKEKMKNMNLLVFPGVQMLQKSMLKPQIMEGPSSTELAEHLSKEEMLCEADKTCIKDSISNVTSVAIEPRGDEINEPIVESSLQLPGGSLDNTDTKRLVELGTAHDTQEGKSKALMTPGLICGFQDQADEITECQDASSNSVTPVIDLTAIGLGSQSSEHAFSEQDDRPSVYPCTVSGAPECGKSALCAYREDTRSVDCEVIVEDHTVKDIFNCHKEGSVHPATETRNTQPQEETILHEFEVSIERVGCSDSACRNQMYNGDRSEYYLEEKTLITHELPSNSPAVVQTSLTLGGIYSTSSKCYKDSADLVNSISEQITEDKSRDCRLLLDCSYSSSHENGLKTHKALVSAVDSSCDPTCGAYLESNGHCKSKEVVSGSLGVIVDSVND